MTFIIGIPPRRGRGHRPHRGHRRGLGANSDGGPSRRAGPARRRDHGSGPSAGAGLRARSGSTARSGDPTGPRSQFPGFVLDRGRYTSFERRTLAWTCSPWASMTAASSPASTSGSGPTASPTASPASCAPGAAASPSWTSPAPRAPRPPGSTTAATSSAPPATTSTAATPRFARTGTFRPIEIRGTTRPAGFDINNRGQIIATIYPAVPDQQPGAMATTPHQLPDSRQPSQRRTAIQRAAYGQDDLTPGDPTPPSRVAWEMAPVVPQATLAIAAGRARCAACQHAGQRRRRCNQTAPEPIAGPGAEPRPSACRWVRWVIQAADRDRAGEPQPARGQAGRRLAYSELGLYSRTQAVARAPRLLG